jgi:hypothetical protein
LSSEFASEIYAATQETATMRHDVLRTASSELIEKVPIRLGNLEEFVFDPSNDVAQNEDGSYSLQAAAQYTSHVQCCATDSEKWDLDRR